MREFISLPFSANEAQGVYYGSLETYAYDLISNKLHAKSKETLTFKHPFPLEIWQLNLTEMSETSISVF